ncbi:diaminopimelate decarboxylase [Desulfocapsa sulfexigens DSM 10523]|uniref:Diaminopimelate decarboxylase n=1 Tax=Desulfocapsa sulfexigens (strain DSM 10523 / SB164P1) TaxID=1167006 RepID=M1NBS3_DESSD|nr:diaminopimelate decarboxylase [Desulfocapsa sulfexigens]AGF77259.1 diaminopimelate decarboxylase [Desulfocapsa sulfexigens DSM 10523]
MNHFEYKNGELFCEDLAVSDIAKEVGTPFYLYSKATLTRHFQAFDSGFEGIDHITCFAVKSCSNIAILSLFGGLGGGADIVSGGELFRALQAGIDPGKIIYSGVGKTESELRYGLQSNILFFNVESEQELHRLNTVAADMGVKAPVSFRVNPDVDPKTHAYISTGLAKNKFGIPIHEALDLYLQAEAMEHIEVKGVSCHIGSQLTLISPFVETLRKLKAFVGRLAENEITIQYIDLGGGVGITYDDEEPPHPKEYASAIKEELDGLSATLILEPGRVIVGNAGILVTEVQYTKSNRGGAEEKHFVVVDAGMNDLTRPSLYGAYHRIEPVKEDVDLVQVADVVGPICETGDFLGKDIRLPHVEQGDLLAVFSAGAYGFTMASNYNSRPRVAEVMVSGDQFRIIRERESMESLIQGESIPEFVEK